MESFTDRMRKVTISARGDCTSFKEYKDAADVKRFFEVEVAERAMEKIEQRAAKGHFTSNILEYGFYEYFYVTHDGEVVRMTKFEKIPGAYLHRIHKVVHDAPFRKILADFVNTLGDMRTSCWYPGRDDLINVVTVSWAPAGTDAGADADVDTDATDATSPPPQPQPKPKKKSSRKPAARAAMAAAVDEQPTE